MKFDDNYYEVVKNAISDDILKFMQINCKIHEEAHMHYAPKEKEFPFSDRQGPRSFAWYGSFHSDALLVFMRDKISKITGKELCETYSYYRTYFNGSILEKHVDRPSCEYSATLCIEKSNSNWPIYFEVNDRTVEVELSPGDMIVYKGDILPHWREEYKGDYHRQMFLHYIDVNGQYYPFNKYDGRKLLGLSNKERVKIF